jgi:hypothetical protein
LSNAALKCTINQRFLCSGFESDNSLMTRIGCKDPFYSVFLCAVILIWTKFTHKRPSSPKRIVQELVNKFSSFYGTPRYHNKQQRTKADLCARTMTSTQTQTLPEAEGRPAAAKHQVKICKH